MCQSCLLKTDCNKHQQDQAGKGISSTPAVLGASSAVCVVRAEVSDLELRGGGRRARPAPWKQREHLQSRQEVFRMLCNS